MNNPVTGYNHYAGIIHVHSTYSDGTKPVDSILRIANELQEIDFLLLTDHNTLKPKFDGLEGWYNRVLLGVGCELNDPGDQNHYLSFDYDEEIDSSLSKIDYVCRVRELGGFGIIAHPNESRDSMPEYPPYPWMLWDSDCYDGIEIWNHMSEWMEGLTHRNKYRRAIHPRRSIIAPKKETLQRWDQVNMDRKVVGIGGVDAHEHIYKIFGVLPFRIFRYKVSFKTIRTHVFTRKELSYRNDRYQHDLKLIYDGIRHARCYVSHHYLGSAADFRFYAQNQTESATMGDTIRNDGKVSLYVINPRKAETRLIHNGGEVARKNGQEIIFTVEEAGVYRVETMSEERPWILSNHIRVTDGD